MAQRRKRYLDNAAPADNTANVVRPVNRMIQVKQQDTPARREEENRKTAARREAAKWTPANPRQASIGPYREKTALDKQGGRLYAAGEDRRKQEENMRNAGEVLGNLAELAFAPVMGSTYVDMVDAYKRGKRGFLNIAGTRFTDKDAWSKRNPGKALIVDILTPIAAGDIFRGYKAMRLGLRNPVLNITPNKKIEYTRRNSDWLPARSAPIVDLFRLQIPTWGNGSLGFGHKYRAIGRNKGLKDIMENGIRSKSNAYNSVDEVYWAQDAPLREYTKNSPLLVRYDKNGPAVFRKGNFDNPTSSSINPISFYDDNVTLHGRYPFYSGYHEIPKTKEGIQHAMLLNNLNRFVEQPVRMGTKSYLAYKLYDWLNR